MIIRSGGVIVNMKRFDEIHEIDKVNRFVRFGVGVSWKKLTEALAAEGMRIIMPLAHDEFVKRAPWMAEVKEWETPEEFPYPENLKKLMQ